MDMNKKVAIPCGNPYCSLNWVMPLWVALNILCQGWEITCPICRRWAKQQIDTPLIEEENDGA